MEEVVDDDDELIAIPSIIDSNAHDLFKLDFHSDPGEAQDLRRVPHASLSALGVTRALEHTAGQQETSPPKVLVSSWAKAPNRALVLFNDLEDVLRDLRTYMRIR